MPTQESVNKLINQYGGASVAGAFCSPARLGVYDTKNAQPDRQYQVFPHIEIIDNRLRAIAEGKLKRLMVFMPPRHGKSETISKYFPAWFLGRNPHASIILCAHTTNLAQQFGSAARDILLQHGDNLFGTTIRSDSRSKSDWKTHAGGGLLTAGIGGPITGRGAHVLIIDDPIKNDEEAFSETYREKNWNWWLSTASTRLMKGGAVIVVQTRWHEDDLAGRMIKDESEEWDIINLPALCDTDFDMLGREQGDPLCPYLIPAEQLEVIKKRSGEYFWNSLYQQRPSPIDGGLFKRSWIKHWTKEGDLYGLEGRGLVSESECYKVTTVDLAASLRETADYTVISTWAVTPNRDLLLLDVIRERLDGPDQLNMIRQAYFLHQPAWLGIEKAGYQLTAIQTLVRDGLPIRELIPDKDKVARALPFATRMQAGTVFFPRNASYYDDIVNELILFPNGKHDDFVDTGGYAARDLFENVMPVAY